MINFRYRKYNPYDEGVAITREPDIVTFQTDFNVTFGLIVCYDLVVDKPVNMLIKRGIRNFAFSTMWHSTWSHISCELQHILFIQSLQIVLIFLSIIHSIRTAVQYQQMWSYGNNVNLLASNANWPEQNITGSGIYAGRRGALKVFVSEMHASKVLVAKVPIELPSENEIVNPKADEDIKEFPKNTTKQSIDFEILPEHLNLFTVEFLNFSKHNSFNGSVCKDDFCCNYDIVIRNSTNEIAESGVSISCYLQSVLQFNIGE